MARDHVLEIAKALHAHPSTLKLPFPGSKVLSERMLNLSYLFGEIRNYAAEGCFQSLAAEVAALELKHANLVAQHEDVLTLLAGWIESHSPARYKAEHRADLDKKIAALQELS